MTVAQLLKQGAGGVATLPTAPAPLEATRE
jgi:hypothetical protein